MPAPGAYRKAVRKTARSVHPVRECLPSAVQRGKYTKRKHRAGVGRDKVTGRYGALPDRVLAYPPWLHPHLPALLPRPLPCAPLTFGVPFARNAGRSVPKGGPARRARQAEGKHVPVQVSEHYARPLLTSANWSSFINVQHSLMS